MGIDFADEIEFGLEGGRQATGGDDGGIHAQFAADASDESADELGIAGDDLDIVTDRIETTWGPVFVFRDRGRVMLKQVKKLVAEDRPLA